MPHQGPRVLACALGLLLFLPTLVSAEDREDPIRTQLAVQNALRRGRDMMAAQQHEEAVHVLESELERVNGSREYLTALRDAYRSYVQQLKLAKRDADAEVYQRRLKVLDPGSVLDQPPAPASPVSDASKKRPEPPAEKPIAQDKQPTPAASKQKEARTLVAKARSAYDDRKFDLACQCFDQAHQLDPESLAESREQWAYSKLFHVVDQLQKSSDEPAVYAQLERDVRVAMSLAPSPHTPQLESFGNKLLERIKDRTGQKGSGSTEAPGGQLSFQHRSEPIDGWQVTETQNIRIFHHQQRELAEKAIRLADKTRIDMQKKWLDTSESWSPRCDIYLHDNADAYSRATNVPRSLPGHSRISTDPKRGVVERQVHLRCDDLNLLVGTLPHEVTHVVLGGQFGEKLPPRWVDEGVAVLSEPRERIELHLRNLPDHRSNQQLFKVRELMRLDDYPEQQRVGAFYAQSVSVVDFLTHKREPMVFTQFVREGMYKGYEGALKKYYGYNSFDELESDWTGYAFGGGKLAGGK